MKIDLHCHSVHSDGTDTVREILMAAEKLGIKGLCISDHDNFGGSLEAFQIKKGLYSGELIPGIEISTRVLGKTVHLLAYLPSFDVLDNQLFRTLDDLKNERVRRMRKMISLANEHGYAITFEEVLEEVSGEDGEQPIDVIGRPHFAKVFIRKGYAKDLEDAFDNFIGDGKPLYAQKISPTYEEWISMVHSIGGLISWAHPLHGHNSDFASFTETADILMKYVDAIELNYNYDGKYRVSKELQIRGKEYLKGAINNNNLLVTAGGDYHGNVGVLGIVDLAEDDWLSFKRSLFRSVI